MEGEIKRERTIEGMCVIGSLAMIMRGRNISMEIMRVKEQYPSANTDV